MADLSARTRLLRMYQSDKGIWHYEMERNGVKCFSSLRTRNDADARFAYERLRRIYCARSRGGEG